MKGIRRVKSQSYSRHIWWFYIRWAGQYTYPVWQFSLIGRVYICKQETRAYIDMRTVPYAIGYRFQSSRRNSNRCHPLWNICSPLRATCSHLAIRNHCSSNHNTLINRILGNFAYQLFRLTSCEHHRSQFVLRNLNGREKFLCDWFPLWNILTRNINLYGCRLLFNHWCLPTKKLSKYQRSNSQANDQY